MSSEQYLSTSSSSNPESRASDGVSADLAQMETDGGQEQDAGSSSQASGADSSEITRGAWMGSSVSEYEIDWLYRSRRIPEGVSCRLPATRSNRCLTPANASSSLLISSAASASVSSFFRSFLDFYKLQPHHLPGNAIFYLSCYVTFMEAYIGIRPTRETFARFFALRINSVQGLDIPKPKPPVQCGSCIIGSRQGSPFFKFSGLESCRLWQGTFFYVRNNGAADLIDLPPFDPAPPTKTNWSYNPKESHNETNRIIRFMKQQMKDTNICSDDIIRTFISRRVLPLKRRAHKMCEMYGPGDPTKITGLPLSKKDVVLKARQICQTSMPEDWEWGLRPLSSTNPPTQEAKDRFPGIESDRRGRCRKRGLDKFDPDPVIFGMFPQPTSNHRSMSMSPRCRPRQAKSLWTNSWPKARRTRPRLLMPAQANLLLPSASRPNLSQDLNSSSSLKPAPWCRHPLPPLGRHNKFGARGPYTGSRAEKIASPPRPKTPAPATWRRKEPSGRAEPLVPPVLEKKKKEDFQDRAGNLPATSTPTPPETSVPEAAGATPTLPPTQGPPATAPKPPPATLKITDFLKPGASRGKTAGGSASSGSQPLVLHVGPAAVVVQDKPSGLLGRIVELKREGKDLGPLLPYAQRWNDADISAATRGLGKDRLPAPDPAGPRSTEEHFTRLKHAVKEFDSAWYDATSNVVSTADARKALFEELLWEHRNLAGAQQLSRKPPLRPRLPHSKLIRDHQKALEAQKEISRELKDQAIQAGVRHAEELKAAAEARLNEALEDAGNANVVLQAELEEAAKALKTAEGKAAAHKAAAEEATRAQKAAEGELFKTLWPGEVVPDTFSLISDRLKGAQADPGVAVLCCPCRSELSRVACSGIRLDRTPSSACMKALPRSGPVLTAKRQDRAYHIVEYAEMRTFIPLRRCQGLSSEEEEDEGEDVPPEAPDAGAAPPEAPAA
ncbi:hypothetical protein QYE76_071963 [Lolium multiflorum]|uniref:Transposase (putative) gypsy type domain-containing protein n=1 Tax=Lolium multiflorum TaxID=4521 RepID=A0AAD8VEI5_LOLMU|nr:hypothetical protein QYE76_071963 [Lolium multiflorum]